MKLFLGVDGIGADAELSSGTLVGNVIGCVGLGATVTVKPSTQAGIKDRIRVFPKTKNTNAQKLSDP